MENIRVKEYLWIGQAGVVTPTRVEGAEKLTAWLAAEVTRPVVV
ncbi:hypothetical protein [Streptosporangium sp. CA-115845]